MAACGLAVVENLVEDNKLNLSNFRFLFQKDPGEKKEKKRKRLDLNLWLYIYARVSLCLSENEGSTFSACALRARTLKTTDEILTNEETKCDLSQSPQGQIPG
jgi:hypothetical protein